MVSTSYKRNESSSYPCSYGQIANFYCFELLYVYHHYFQRYHSCCYCGSWLPFEHEYSHIYVACVQDYPQLHSFWKAYFLLSAFCTLPVWPFSGTGHKTWSLQFSAFFCEFSSRFFRLERIDLQFLRDFSRHFWHFDSSAFDLEAPWSSWSPVWRIQLEPSFFFPVWPTFSAPFAFWTPPLG